MSGRDGGLRPRAGVLWRLPEPGSPSGALLRHSWPRGWQLDSSAAPVFLHTGVSETLMKQWTFHWPHHLIFFLLPKGLNGLTGRTGMKGSPGCAGPQVSGLKTWLSVISSPYCPPTPKMSSYTVYFIISSCGVFHFWINLGQIPD